MDRRYSYVGPHDLLKLLDRPSLRACIRKPGDVLKWVDSAKPSREDAHTIIATFVIDLGNDLWVADRRSEHVVCAQGGEVLSAGEMTFALNDAAVEGIEVTNQSTGYCPKPESWPAVAAALDRIGLPHPDDFTTAFIFRRCDTCGSTNIVKEGWFECAVCLSPLSEQWNFA